ncbi:MAG TPA: FtsX-like permease family protein [Candidatus Limnocylindria bacterium]|nr:FtsX-like permease family protein [Candidatus Limnocylindria bacterium]
MRLPASLPLLRLLWARFSWRHWVLAPGQSLLLVGILALGVAVFFAIRLASLAAATDFQDFTQILSSDSDGVISAPAGALQETVLLEIREILADEPAQAVAVLETTGTPPRSNEAELIGDRPTYELLGIDLVAAQNLGVNRRLNRGWFNQESTSGAGNDTNRFWQTITRSNAIFVSAALAEARKLYPGGSLPLVLNEHVVELHVAGIIPADPARPRTPSKLLLMDLPALQTLLERPGSLTRIEIILEEGPDRAERWQAIRSRLVERGGSRWIVGTSADRRASGQTMTQAFRLNLTILSLLALAVGLYLVFQALDGAVVRRREEIAVLRSLGVPARDMQKAWLLEAAVLGALGSSAGLVLGWVGAQGAVRLVGRTINALYYATNADRAGMDWREAVLALLLGTVASVLAGWLPAKSAAEIPPAQSLGHGKTANFAGPALLRRVDLAVVLLVFGVVLIFLPPLRLSGGVRLPVGAYASAFCWVLGGGILGGAAVKWIARGLRIVFRETATVRMGLSYLVEPSGRHRLALAGLVCAVSMTAAMAILVGSFNRTMTGWIGRTFQADLYITSDGAQSASVDNRISATTWRQIIAYPAVEQAQVVQAARVRLPAGDTLLVGSNLAFFQKYARPAWAEKPVSDLTFNSEAPGEAAIVSESFSERFGVHRGDIVKVPSPTGEHEVTIQGVYSDYGNERGSLMVPRERFAAWFGDEQASNLILVLRHGNDDETVRAAIRRQFPGLAVFTQSHLRGEATRMFKQTFSITYALEIIGVAVAVAGLGFTLASLLWERRDQLATLRAMGLRRRELAAVAAWEGMVTALAGVSVGIVVSFALGWLLIYRVNKQTFGWTLEPAWPWLQLGALALLVVVVAGMTSWAVGLWGARLPGENEE